MEKIILNETLPKSARQFMVRDIPHGYDNPAQFNYEHKTLLGPEWNTPTTYNVNIRPKTITDSGQNIMPISKTNQPKTKHF